MSRHRARHLLGQGSGGSRLGSPLGRPSSLRLLGDSGPKQSPLSSLPLWTPGRSAPSSQRSDGTLGLAWIAAPYLDPPGSRGLGIFPSPRERSREGSFPPPPPPDFTCGSAPWLSLLDSPWAPQAQPLTPSIPILRCHRFWPALQVQIAPAREPLVVNLRQHG